MTSPAPFTAGSGSGVSPSHQQQPGPVGVALAADGSCDASSSSSSSSAAAASTAASSSSAAAAASAPHMPMGGMQPKFGDGLGAVRHHDDVASLSLNTSGKRASCLIIYTGGTIGMKKSDDGMLRPAHGYLEHMLRTVPEFLHPDVPSYDVLEWATLLDSSDFSPQCWVTLAEQIDRHYYDYDGFVILHGTDTMAYTASALSFMLEHLGKAVILTGAMIPLSAPVSDAKRNLIVSLLCAVNLDIPEVCIFFNNVLLRGNRAKKLDPGTINPFDSPNFPPLAEMGVRISLRRELLLQAPRRKFTSHRTLFGNIAVMIMVPGFDDLALEAFLATSTAERPAVLVLLLYGAGNAPSAKKSFLDCLRKGVAEKGAVVVILSQCLHGTVDMAQYATGSVLRALGVIDGRDMTVEASVTKLAYLLGRGLRGSGLKLAMESNLRGELTLKTSLAYTAHSSSGGSGGGGGMSGSAVELGLVGSAAANSSSVAATECIGVHVPQLASSTLDKDRARAEQLLSRL